MRSSRTHRVPRGEFPNSFLPTRVAIAADIEMEAVMTEDLLRHMGAAVQNRTRA